MRLWKRKSIIPVSLRTQQEPFFVFPKCIIFIPRNT